MASSTGHRPGWKAVFDPGMWVRALLVTATGVVSMALLACIVALVRDSAGHDWYATGKLVLSETLIELHFDEDAPVAYRTSSGEVRSLTRDGLRFNGDALLARDHLLRTAGGALELGAWCGFGGALLCLMLFRRPKDERRVQSGPYGPAPAPRPQARERFAPPPASARVAAAPPAAAAPVPAVPARAPESEPPRPAKPEPAVTRQDRPDTGGDDKTAPDRVEDEERDNERWI